MTYLEHLNDKFDFGKFSGRTLGEVMIFNPNYLLWVVNNVSGQRCRITDSAIEEIKQIFPDFFISDTFEQLRLQQLQWEYDYAADDFSDDNPYRDDDEPTYERYNGSYAQNEMGYSDDDIDTIFDGDPSAYWNID